MRSRAEGEVQDGHRGQRGEKHQPAHESSFLREIAEPAEYGRDLRNGCVRTKSDGREEDDGEHADGNHEFQGGNQPPGAAEGLLENEKDCHRSQGQSGLLEIKPLQERRDGPGQEERQGQTMAGSIPSRQPPRNHEQQEAQDDGDPVGDLDQGKRDGFPEESQPVGQRGSGGADQKNGTAQERVRSDGGPQEHTGSPAGAHEAPGQDQGREHPRQNVVDDPVDEEGRNQPVMAAYLVSQLQEPEGVCGPQPSGNKTDQADELSHEEGRQGGPEVDAAVQSRHRQMEDEPSEEPVTNGHAGHRRRVTLPPAESGGGEGCAREAPHHPGGEKAQDPREGEARGAGIEGNGQG